MYSRLLIMLSFISTILAKHNYHIEVRKVHYTSYAEDVIQNANMSTSKNREGQSVISIQFMLSRNLSNFRIRSTLNMFRGINGKLNIMSFDADGCTVLDASHQNRLLLVAQREVRRVSNLPNKCPLLANVKYLIRNFTVVDDNYPPFLPFLSWEFVQEVWIAEKHHGDFVYKGLIKKKE